MVNCLKPAGVSRWNLLSTGVVALAEIGDKTQLLLLFLLPALKNSVPIILGISYLPLFFNHGLAGALGA